METKKKKKANAAIFRAVSSDSFDKTCAGIGTVASRAGLTAEIGIVIKSICTFRVRNLLSDDPAVSMSSTVLAVRVTSE